MPPKPKYTKEQMLEAALGIVRKEGESALTARHLGEVLGTSSRPIFTLFKNMEELVLALREPAMEVFQEMCSNFSNYSPAFKKLGQNLVEFAENEPHLFRFLFIDAHGKSITISQWCRSGLGDEAIMTLMRDHDLDEPAARLLFQEMWLHTFSICVMKVTKAVEITDKEISDSLSRAFTGLLGLAKSGHLSDAGVVPKKVNRD